MKAIAAGIAFVMLALVGCTMNSGKALPAPTSSGRNSVPADGPFPQVVGAYGGKPSLSFDAQSTPSSTLQRRVVREGTGPQVAIGDLLALDYLGQIWKGAVFDNSYDRHVATTVQIGIGSVIKGWDRGLVGIRTGSRVVLTVPPSLGYGTGGNKSAHISGTDTLVFVVDIARAYNLRSTADPAATVQPAPLSAPSVRGALTAAPTISIPRALKPPTARATYLLARGTGRAVIKGTVVAQYVAVDWTGGIQQSTWQNGTATSVPVGDTQNLTGGLFDGLVGLPIGSRVLITAPAPPGQDKRRNSVAVVLDIVDEVTTAKSM